MRINGPGAALTFHLDTFAKMENTLRSVKAGTARDNVTFVQRAKLMSSIGVIDRIDGQTVATSRDKPAEIGSTLNLRRTIAHVESEYEALDKAETHYVSAHVAATVAAAAEVADAEPLFPTDLPVKHGLIVLETPMLLQDLDPDTGVLDPRLKMPITAILFSEADIGVKGEARQGVWMTLYTETDSFVANYLESYQAFHSDSVEDMRLGAEALRIWAVDTTGWAYGTPWVEVEFDPAVGPGPGEIIGSMAYLRRWFLAYCRWTWQRILLPETHTPARHEARRWMRQFDHEPHIKVLRLRRMVESGHNDSEDAAMYQRDHQWIVRGHWRRQWYASLGPARNDDGTFNLDSHRLIWVEPHLAGNPNGPLVVGHNVTAAVR